MTERTKERVLDILDTVDGDEFNALIISIMKSSDPMAALEELSDFIEETIEGWEEEEEDDA